MYACVPECSHAPNVFLQAPKRKADTAGTATGNKRKKAKRDRSRIQIVGTTKGVWHEIVNKWRVDNGQQPFSPNHQ